MVCGSTVMLLLPWGWFRMEKQIQCPEHLKECLAAGSGLEPPTSILPLRAWLGIRVCVPRQVCDACVLALCGCRYKSLHICVGVGWYPPTAGGGRGCGAVVRWRTGVAPREGGLGLSLDDMVCGCHVLGDILEQRELGGS